MNRHDSFKSSVDHRVHGQRSSMIWLCKR